MKSGKHILIVEDDKMTARLLVYRLQALGYTVEHINDGIEGFNYIKEQKPDLIVLDVMLPGMSGFEILENLNSSEDVDISKLNVIMLTTKNKAEEIQRGFNLGALEYLSKPFKIEEFLVRLNRIASTSST